MSYDRSDHRVRTSDGVSLRVRQVCRSGATGCPAIVLVHGIAAPLEPTFDLPLPGYSILELLADCGYRAVALDHRNFGGSDRDPAMDLPPIGEGDRALHSLDDSVEDIRAVIADTLDRYRLRDVTLFGSSRGAIQVLAYAVQNGAGISLVIMNNPSSLCYLAGARAGDELAGLKAEQAAAFRPGNYVAYTAEYQRKRWAKLFGPGGSASNELQEAYLAACMQTDPVASRRDPPVFRVPVESIPNRTPLLELDKLAIPCLAIEGEGKSAEHMATFVRATPTGLARVIAIRGSDHFTLRNDKRFELINIIDAAARGVAWGRR